MAWSIRYGVRRHPLGQRLIEDTRFMRFLLLYHRKPTNETARELLELRRYRLCGSYRRCRLSKLDRDVTKPGMIAALIVGIVGTMIMGIGMCCTMVWGGTLFVLGIVIGILGILGICAAYPLYLRITKKQKDKLTPEIMRLTDELMK